MVPGPAKGFNKHFKCLSFVTEEFLCLFFFFHIETLTSQHYDWTVVVDPGPT